jgi:transcriptional antiterminator RfaH
VKHWFAVHSKPRQENIAEQNLLRQGFDTYLPKIQVRRRRRDKWARVVEPLFPRYLFIRVDPGQHSLSPVRSTLGVAGLVRFGHQIKPVPDAVIAFLRQAEDPQTHRQQADEWPHQSGDQVQVLEGPFAGLEGVFQCASGEDRAILLVELLGRQNCVQLAMDTIVASG